ncbi:ECF RNA polymerase sigma factor SigE [Phycisphaerae bacterium RAS1]|nr:ECF RNA polymerase sigma factor SigE [Phycisphaerae bacterium RAS1]
MSDIDDLLIRTAVAGDEAALMALLAARRPGLCAYVAARLPPDVQGRLDAEDLVQEGFVEIFRHVSRFEPRGPQAFDRWVRTILLHKVRDMIRRQRAQRRGGERRAVSPTAAWQQNSIVTLLELIATEEATPSRVVAGVEAVAALQAALPQLAPDYYQAIKSIHIDGRSVAEVAAEMNRSEGAVHLLCHKARKKLREILGSASRFLSRTD